MNERESIAEIITDMRKRATVASRQDGDAMVHHSAIGDMLTDFANRIEAAYNQTADMIERCEKLLAKYNNMPCKQCADGEVEPDCPYFGEPGGCSSPTYNKFYDERIGDLNYILRGDRRKE